jgi:iron complex transport system ATP-binding protein
VNAGLIADGVSVTFGARKVLQEISLTFRPGEVTAVVGPNGAGKSTLLSCLAGLRRPATGAVTLDGRPVLAFADRDRARRIGYLPQTPEIAWPLDVHTFVRLGRTAHRGVFGESAADAAAVDRALERAGVLDLTDRDVTTLSGGERARVLIARALAGEPAWLLADEPLTGLDLSHQFDAGRLLREVAREGAGVVATLHDLAFAVRTVDRVVVLAEGRVVADGVPTEALSPSALASVYGVEARWVDGGGGPMLDLLKPHG